MQELLSDDGTLIIDDEAIMNELVKFYSNIFSNDPTFHNNQAVALHTLLQSTKQTLLAEQIKCLKKARVEQST